MEHLKVRNAHTALPVALRYLQRWGQRRGSRNGSVMVSPVPVVTEYERPLERVVFWDQRDANPFFHLYEAMWMLAGRNDVEPLLRYVKRFAEFSDDGETLAGAYGHRWRHAFGYDQLHHVITRLRENPDDRRCVIQMWSGAEDSDGGKDVPCNLVITAQRDAAGALDLTVFCRSNDIIWGAYGANAVHFGFLHEYLAVGIGCPVGIYRQISVNWHAYEATLTSVANLPSDVFYRPWAQPTEVPDPYRTASAHPMSLTADSSGPAAVAAIDRDITRLLMDVDLGFIHHVDYELPFFVMASLVLRAHNIWRLEDAPARFELAFDVLRSWHDQKLDWIVASREWLDRRYARWARTPKSIAESV